MAPLHLSPRSEAQAGESRVGPEPTFKGFEKRYGAGEIPPGLEENEALRSLGTKVFEVPGGGAHLAQIFSTPIHYRDHQGRWKEIDATVVPTDGGFRNAAHEFTAFFPERLSESAPVELSHGATSLTMALAGAAGAAAAADETSVAYADVLPGVDVEYALTNEGYKESLTLASPEAQAAFTYRIETRGLELVALGDGRIEIRRGAGSIGFFPRSFVQEAPDGDGMTGAANYDVVETELRHVTPNVYELGITVDGSWLAAPARRYPVVVDPSFVNSACGTCPPGTGVPLLKDASFATGQSSMGWEDLAGLRLGLDNWTCCGGREAKTYMTFDVAHEIRKVGNLVYDAKFDIYNSNSSIQSPATYELKRITSEWTENGSMGVPPVDESTVWAALDPCKIQGTWQCGHRSWWRWDVTALMQYWIDKGTGSNHGFRLSAVPHYNASDWRDMVADEGYALQRPYIFVAVNAMPSTRTFTPDDSSWPYLDLASDAPANGATVSGPVALKIKDLTDANQDPIVVRYQVSKSSDFQSFDIVHDSGWIAETQQHTVPSTALGSGTYYWRVMASDTCGAEYVDKDDPEARNAGLCDDLSHDVSRPRLGAIERPMSKVRWFTTSGSTSNFKAHLVTDVTASSPGGGGWLQLDSVEGFSSGGGEATFEPDNGARETFTYTGVDATAERLLGVMRGASATAHAEGTVVQGGSTSSTPPSELIDLGVETPPFEAHGPREVVAPPSTAWLNEHCVTHQYDQAPNVIQPVFVWSGYKQRPEVSNWQKPIRDLVFAADRGLAESHPDFKQHWRLVCDKNWDGSWAGISVLSIDVPTSVDDHQGQFDVAGKIDCGEADGWIRETFGVDQDMRLIKFFDTSINTGGDRDGNCSYARSYAMADEASTDSTVRAANQQPGTGNPNNFRGGYANADADGWPRGLTGSNAATVAHEFYHSIGAVSKFAPGHNPYLSKKPIHHTNDYPDIMNNGYFLPTNSSIRNDCWGTATWERLTYKNLFMDCGRDTYWAVSARPRNWLCTHYNLAWDSLYLQPRPPRPVECQA